MLFFKEVFTTIYERMLAERNRLQEQINSLQKQIAVLPEGKLVCVHNGKYIKWFQSDGHVHNYIPKKEHMLIEQLATKKYLSLLLEDLLHEQKAINFYLRHHNSKVSKAKQLLNDIPDYKDFLSSYFTPIDQELVSWTNSPYTKNNKYPEQLIYKALSGNYVRSKSETIIDMFLYTNKIPFRYECALPLGDTILFPDFTIRHPKTGKFFYWEHFGMIDNAAYCQNMASKLQLYTSHGITPSIQLITTYETKEHPLSAEMVEHTIRYYFL